MTDRKQILLVDDEERVLEVLSRRLKSWGYEVLTAVDGEECLQMVGDHQPDLILLDILLPKMRGREVCTQLKDNSQTRHIPIVFLTALGMPEQIEAGFNLGAVGYIIKPFNPQELRERISECLSSDSFQEK